VKNLLFCLLFTLYIPKCFAQETTVRNNRLTDSVTETFEVLKTNKDIKQGLYRALFKRKKLVATGNYTNNKKTGIWNFYKPNNQLVQRFNYDKNQLIFESGLDTLYDVHYLIDQKIEDTDTLTRPVKTGGVYYGLIPYISAFQLPFDTFEINTDDFDAVIELLISPLGRLADYKIHVVSDYYKYKQIFNLDVNLFNEEDRQFIPATLNSKPVLSRIIIKCFVNSTGKLDFY
jgi:hypothetical protein